MARPERPMSIGAVVAIYWTVSAVWIVGSDTLLSMSLDRSTEALFDIAKGLAFVTVTAGLLLVLLQRRQRALDAERERNAELRERLERTSRMDAVGRFAGGVAHDFNNLLSVMRGHLDLTRLDADDDQLESLEMMDQALDRAVLLTGELQAVASRQRLDLETVDLGDVVEAHRSTLEGLVGSEIDVTVDRPDTPVPVRIDTARFQQVILNLSTNARDAMPAGGRLRLGVSRRGDEAVLLVADTGHGMSTEQLAHCFEPFYTTKPSGKGTGLGLALSYGVVRQSGGEMTIRSRPNAGTEVEVTLPITP